MGTEYVRPNNTAVASLSTALSSYELVI